MPTVLVRTPLPQADHTQLHHSSVAVKVEKGRLSL